MATNVTLIQNPNFFLHRGIQQDALAHGQSSFERRAAHSAHAARSRLMYAAASWAVRP